jgi:hypothetical protein
MKIEDIEVGKKYWATWGAEPAVVKVLNKSDPEYLICKTSGILCFRASNQLIGPYENTSTPILECICWIFLSVIISTFCFYLCRLLLK